MMGRGREEEKEDSSLLVKMEKQKQGRWVDGLTRKCFLGFACKSTVFKKFGKGVWGYFGLGNGSRWVGQKHKDYCSRHA